MKKYEVIQLHQTLHKNETNIAETIQSILTDPYINNAAANIFPTRNNVINVGDSLFFPRLLFAPLLLPRVAEEA